MPTKIAAQPSKYKCDGNDKHDTGGNHQDLEGVIAWNVMVWTLYALRRHDCNPCQRTPVYLLAFLFTWECRPSHSALNHFEQSFSSSSVMAPRPDGQAQGLRHDGCRQTSYDVLNMPN